MKASTLREKSPEELREELSPALEFVEETVESPADGAREADASTVDAPPVAEAIILEEAPPVTAAPDLEEERLLIRPTPSMVETVPEVAPLLPMGLEPIILGLGLLFIFLIILTLIARGRR